MCSHAEHWRRACFTLSPRVFFSLLCPSLCDREAKKKPNSSGNRIISCVRALVAGLAPRNRRCGALTSCSPMEAATTLVLAVRRQGSRQPIKARNLIRNLSQTPAAATATTTIHQPRRMKTRRKANTKIKKLCSELSYS